MEYRRHYPLFRQQEDAFLTFFDFLAVECHFSETYVLFLPIIYVNL